MEEEREVRMKEMGMGESAERRAMALEMKEKVYPPPLHSHEDVVNDKALFMASLSHFHSSMGTIFSTPVLGGKEIDLHLLYKEVTQRAGLEKVILEKRLREITEAFCFPPTTTNASFVLRKCYLSLLYHYEQVYFFGAQGTPILPAASSLTKISKSKLKRPPVASMKPKSRKREHLNLQSKGESSP